MRAPRALLLLTVFALSCRDPLRTPPVKGPPLKIPKRSSKRHGSNGKPLEVLHVSPAGQTDTRHVQITATFNKAMVPMGRVEKRDQLAPLHISPPVAGKQRWLSSRTLTFAPAKPLPGSTSYELRIEAGIRAQDGSVLEKPKRWSFTTERLRVVRRVRPSRWAQPDQKVKLAFNQPVSAQKVAARASFVARQRGKAEPVTIAAQGEPGPWRRRGKPDPRVAVLRPATALPLDARITLRVGAGLVGEAGPESMKGPFVTSFSTYGPLRVVGLGCQKKCNPSAQVRVTFSNPVPIAKTLAAIRLDGRKVRSKLKRNYNTAYVYLPVKLAPRHRYTLTIPAGLRDRFGQRLKKRVTLRFTTGDYRPYARLPVNTGVVEASGPKRIPLAFRNAEKAAVFTKRIAPRELAKLLHGSSFRWRSKPIVSELAGVKRRELSVRGHPNRRVVHRVALDKALGAGGRGIVALELHADLPGRKSPRIERALLRVTDLGITAKYAPRASLVWVTSLRSGKPVSGASVTIWRPGDPGPLWQGKTDASGIARAPGVSQLGGKRRDFLFIAEHGGDTSYTHSSTRDGIDAWRFGIRETWEERERSLIGMVFSDRGIYRPGATVKLKGILRRRAGDLELPRGTVTVRVADPRGEKLLEQKRKLSSYGSFHLDVEIPRAARLGYYAVVVKSPAGQVRGGFRVQEFRPAEFAVEVRPERAQLVRGDTLRWTTSGRYLFGAPMRSAKLRWSVDRRPASFRPPKHDGYVFRDEVWWWGDRRRRRQYGHVADGRGELDAQGLTQAKLVLAPPGMNGPSRYTVESTVTDISRQRISARRSVLLHPGEIYLGIKLASTFVDAKKPFDAQLVAVTPKGARRSGAKIKATLYRRTWHSVRRKGYGGAHHWVSRPVEKPVDRCSLVSSRKPHRCRFTPPSGGYYVLRAAGKDRRGTPLMTSVGLYVSGSGYAAWRRDSESKVELVTDRQRYKVGQTARVLIKSPFRSAYGLLTVERDGIFSRKRLKVRGSSAWVSIPIDEKLLPNAFVSVTLVRGRVKARRGRQKATTGSEDPGRPLVKVGYAKLKISQAPRELSVKVAPRRAEHRPGDEVEVDLTVRDHRGKPVRAELTVFAADEGVLSLIGYRTPDPMGVFYASRGLSVRTADNRIVLISRRLFGQKGGNPGGGGGGGHGARRVTSSVRRTFRATPYFAPSIITDAHGHARASFRLPDNLTTFRIMAVASSTASQFGSGHSKVVVNKPLLLSPALPRLLRVGDKLEAGVVVHNHTGRSGRVRVRASFAGVAVEGPTERSASVAAGGAAELRFTVRAESPGKARFRFTASLGDERDSVEVKRPIQLPIVKESVASYGSTSDGVSEAIVPSGGIRRDVGGLELTLSSSALVGLKASVAYLLDYPYECLEQTVSRMVPLVLLKQLTTAYGLKKADAIDPLVTKLIGKIEQLQRYSGGFSYWPSTHRVSPWVSAYATWGLAQAAEHGYRVSEQTLKRARAYLERKLRDKVPQETSTARSIALSVKTFIAHALVASGEEKKVDAYLDRLYEQRADIPPFAKTLLLGALARAGGDREAQRTLQRELLSKVHQTARVAKLEANLGSAYAPLFHSSTRSTAMLLDALLRVQPDHPLVDKLVRYLVDARDKRGRWKNTQETVYALQGMYRYYRAREKKVPDFVAKVLLDAHQLRSVTFQGRSLKATELSIPMKQLRGRRGILSLLKQGPGRLYYGARLTYARTKLPSEPWDEGLFVQRSYETVAEGATSSAALRGKPKPQVGDGGTVEVKAGDLVRVKLRLVVPQQMHYVVIDDPLPAGLEAVDFSLMTSSRHTRRRSIRHAPSTRYRSRYGRSAWWYTPFYHRETHDDRVQLFSDSLAPGVYSYVYLARATSLGTFVTPPTHAEQMYEPEVFGRTGTVSFEVAPR